MLDTVRFLLPVPSETMKGISISSTDFESLYFCFFVWKILFCVFSRQIYEYVSICFSRGYECVLPENRDRIRNVFRKGFNAR
jgi:hypothetical protein